MAKQLKKIIVAEFRQRFGVLKDGCVLIDFHGMNAEQTLDLRSRLREKGSCVTVVHNRLARRAWQDREEIPAEFGNLLRGPTAIVYGDIGVLASSKLLVNWRKKNRDLAEIKGGFFEGRVLSPGEVLKLALLPDHETLQGQLAATLISPLQCLGGAAAQLLSHLGACARARHDELAGSEK